MDEIQELIHQLRNGDLHAQIHAGIRLASIGEEATEPLIAVIRDDLVKHAWSYAAQALGLIADKRAIEPLIEMLHNPISFRALLARSYGAYALAQLTDKYDRRALDTLIELVNEPPDWYVDEGEKWIYEDGRVEISYYAEDDERISEIVEYASSRLIELGDKRGEAAALEQLLRDLYWWDIGYVAENISEYGRQKLINELNSADETRRVCSAELLGQIKEKRAVPSLEVVAKNDKVDRVRRSAAFALICLGKPEYKSIYEAPYGASKNLENNELP